MQSYIEELYTRGQRSAEWVAQRVNDDGFLPCEQDLGCYYKCVYPLRSAGYAHKASLLLSRIIDLYLTDNGDLRNSESEKTKGTYTECFSQVYPNSWIILGAWLLGRYDIAKTLMDGVISNYYDPAMGTFRSRANPKEDTYDVNSAAMAVQLFMLFDIEKAEKAAGFLLDHMNGQPDINNRYYSIVEKPFNYVTATDTRNDTYSSVKIGEKNQAFWLLGMPCAALAQLYERTGKMLYLDMAKRFFDINLSCGDAAFCAPGSGKTFWSSSILYRITGDKKYLDSCIKLMDFFFSIQQEDGSFLLPGMKPSDLTPKFLFDTTGEYTRWLLEVAAELSAI